MGAVEGSHEGIADGETEGKRDLEGTGDGLGRADGSYLALGFDEVDGPDVRALSMELQRAVLKALLMEKMLAHPYRQ